MLHINEKISGKKLSAKSGDANNSGRINSDVFYYKYNSIKRPI